MKGVEAEARTMVTWGKTRKEVISFLTGEGMPHERTLKLVEKLFEERNSAIRVRGYQRILIGSLVSLASSILLLTLFRSDDISVHFTPRIPGAGIGISLLGFVWGLWKLMDGVRDCFRTAQITDNLAKREDGID